MVFEEIYAAKTYRDIFNRKGICLMELYISINYYLLEFTESCVNTGAITLEPQIFEASEHGTSHLLVSLLLAAVFICIQISYFLFKLRYPPMVLSHACTLTTELQVPYHSRRVRITLHLVDVNPRLIYLGWVDNSFVRVDCTSIQKMQQQVKSAAVQESLVPSRASTHDWSTWAG